jgi:hypothetical protein
MLRCHPRSRAPGANVIDAHGAARHRGETDSGAQNLTAAFSV